MGLSSVHQMELEARSLDVELCVRLGFNTVSRGGSDKVAIPFVKNGVVVNHKYRTIGGKKQFAQDPEAEKCVWNHDCLLDPSLASEPLIITEGELDAVAAIQAGFLRTVSVPDGAPAKELGGATDAVKYEYLADIIKLVPPTQTIILATDGDGPGVNLMRDLAIRLGEPRCKFLLYPKDGERRLKDLNDVLENYGARGVRETIERATWYAKTGVFSMDELPEEPDRQKYSLHMGPGVDKYVKIRRGDFWVITGIPGHGKSAFVDDMACRLALNDDLRTCFASFEKNPKTDHRRDLRKWIIGENRPVTYGVDVKWTREEVAGADAFIQRSFRFIVPGAEDVATLEWLVDQAAAAVIQQGCDLLVLDPWNEIEHERDRDESLTEYTGRAIKTLKRFATRFNVAVIVVAHPSKMGAMAELSLHSISDSAHWANKCDVGVLVSRNFEEFTASVHFAKVRNDDIGAVGKVKGALDTYTRHFRLD